MVFGIAAHFNSQPHEEADSKSGQRRSYLDYFNSQPHEEADHEHLSFYKNYNISTHSLTKRLTNRVTSFLFGEEYFNSQPHEEADKAANESLAQPVIFQLTASRRG